MVGFSPTTTIGQLSLPLRDRRAGKASPEQSLRLLGCVAIFFSSIERASGSMARPEYISGGGKPTPTPCKVAASETMTTTICEFWRRSRMWKPARSLRCITKRSNGTRVESSPERSSGGPKKQSFSFGRPLSPSSQPDCAIAIPICNAGNVFEPLTFRSQRAADFPQRLVWRARNSSPRLSRRMNTCCCLPSQPQHFCFQSNVEAARSQLANHNRLRLQFSCAVESALKTACARRHRAI